MRCSKRGLFPPGEEGPGSCSRNRKPLNIFTEIESLLILFQKYLHSKDAAIAYLCQKYKNTYRNTSAETSKGALLGKR
jgi:hypothetical protein